MMVARVYAQHDLNLHRAPRLRWVASLAVVVVVAIVAPISAGAAPGMRQAKRYQGPSSASALVMAPFTCVGFEGDCHTLGLGGVRLGEYGGERVSFLVPSRARSVRVLIVDDTGLPVRAFVSGDIVTTRGYPNGSWGKPVCGSSAMRMSLSRRARVLHVSPDVGLFAIPDRFTNPGFQPGCMVSPLSFPTSGSITVVFSRAP